MNAKDILKSLSSQNVPFSIINVEVTTHYDKRMCVCFTIMQVLKNNVLTKCVSHQTANAGPCEFLFLNLIKLVMPTCLAKERYRLS